LGRAPLGVAGVNELMLGGTISRCLEAAADTDRGLGIIDRHLNEDWWTYAQLDERAALVAAVLAEYVEVGDRVCLVGPTSLELLAGLFGAWYAGAVPSVLPLPRRSSAAESFLAQIAARLEHLGAGILLCAGASFEDPVAGSAVRSVRIADILRDGRGELRAERDPDDLALIQFTSGSTSAARAVPVSHRQLVWALEASMASLDVDPEADCVVSWLPLFHDMGLIAMLLGAVGTGTRGAFLPTQEFLARPGVWLDAVTRYRGSITASPAFGFALAARDLGAHPRPLELAPLRWAANGGEPIVATVIDEFNGAGRQHGLSPFAISPVYGLAEATLTVTLVPPTEMASTELLPLGQFTVGQTLPERRNTHPRKAVVSCGRPIDDARCEVRGTDGAALPDMAMGEIWVSSPGVMRDYWREPTPVGEPLRDGWLKTGDLGFMKDGELFVGGRLKDVIFHGGANLFAEDYEAVAESVPGVRKGNAIAFAITDLERMVVIVESAADRGSLRLLANSVFAALAYRLPRAPDEVAVVAPGVVPKTSSGKRQRSLCRDMYVSGGLVKLASASGSRTRGH
jgi:fatty-acyl-CoA synthase